jgi:hypothetical protein
MIFTLQGLMSAFLSNIFTKLGSAAFVVTFAAGCSVAGPAGNAGTTAPAANTASNAPAPDGAAPKGATITIDVNGPADTVRAFYKLLREKKFRDAIFLTNLRPAIEGLTEAELAGFSLDFEALAGQIPAEIEINGEIISGDLATVTANLPADNDGTKEIQQIRLKKTGKVWIIQTVDEVAEARIQSEGNRYFYNLRIETHEDEARKMLERIAKAEIAYSLQNGTVGDIDALIGAGVLPDDVKTSASTGYIYTLTITGKTRYYANAIPAEYGKSGKLSFLLEPDEKGIAHVTSKENDGKTLKK